MRLQHITSPPPPGRDGGFLKRKRAPDDQTQIRERTANGRPGQQAQPLLSLHKPPTSPPSSTQTYPSLTSFGTEGSSLPLKPVLSHSPTMQRLHQTAQAHFEESPTTSGSPDESVQSLLDNWCHTFSNAAIDTTADSSSLGGPVGAEISSLAGISYSTTNTDARRSILLDGSDYSYWEALVNEIQYNISPPPGRDGGFRKRTSKRAPDDQAQIREHTTNGRPEQQAQTLLSPNETLTSPPYSTQTYPSLTSLSIEGAPPLKPVLSHSPTMHRLHQTAQAHFEESSTTSGSPDESAQSLLDDWYHTVINATIDTTTNSLSLGRPIGTGTEIAGITYSATNTDARLDFFSGLDGSDREALVNEMYCGS